MAKDTKYEWVVVESHIPTESSGRHGKVHIRPVAGGKYPTTLAVQCSKDLSRNYPVGTKFRVMAKLTDREGKGEYLYSSFRWEYDVLK